jgi:hypothetical protein
MLPAPFNFIDLPRRFIVPEDAAATARNIAAGVGCFGYLAQSFTAIALPAHLPVVVNLTLPLVLPGELLVVIWLLVKGAKVPLPVAQRSEVS